MRRLIVGTAAVLGLAATPADAVIQYGDLQVAGSVHSQGAFQHDGTEGFEFVQARNLLNFNLEYEIGKRGELFGRWRVPWLDKASLYVQYRGAFDPVFRWRDRYERVVDPESQGEVEHENTLRDLYLDVSTRALGPGRLSLRIGRQQVVWGEADVVRSLDVINPLDFRKNFLLGPDQPNLNEYRIPLWMLKALYSWRGLGPIENTAFEAIWIPGDIEPLRGYAGEVFGFPFDMERRPSNLPFDRVRHPFAITRIGPGFTDVPAQAVLQKQGSPNGLGAFCGDPAALGDCRADLLWFNKDHPFEGDPILPPKNSIPSRAWIEHSEVGARFLGQIAPFGETIDFSLNWFYTFSDIPAAFANFPAVRDALFGGPRFRDPGTGAGITFEQFRDLGSDVTIWIPAALWYPRTHILGGTLTYSDNRYTGAVWRLEVSHQTKDPRIKPKPPFLAEREGDFTLEDFDENFKATGRTTRAMLGADLFRSWPVLDRILGRGQPIFVSGQVFLEYKENISNTIGTLLDVNDRQKRWNPLYTLLVQYFFKGGQWVPVLIGIYDQDAQHFAGLATVEYHPRNWLTFKVGTIWFTGSKFRQSSRFLHAFADRDETFLRVQLSF